MRCNVLQQSGECELCAAIAEYWRKFGGGELAMTPEERAGRLLRGNSFGKASHESPVSKPTVKESNMTTDSGTTQSPQSVSDAYVKPTRYAKPVRMLLAKIATKEKRK